MIRGSDNGSSLVIMSESAMHLEFNIVERVETFVRHPAFLGSDRAGDGSPGMATYFL
jgi:hypothetical protein